VDVVRDLLDKAVVDRNGRGMGRVDGILLEQEAGRPPRLAAIVIGPTALGSRLHPALGRLASAVEGWFDLGRDRPAKIDCADIEDVGRTIRLRLTIGDTAVAAVEQRLRSWLLKLPGSR
jgi:sporulation protein YlmC with PRC-barrel domain